MKLICYTFFCLLTTCLAACGSDQVTQEDSAATPMAATDSIPAELPQKSEVDAVSYEKKLDAGSMHFLVTTLGEGSMRSLAVQVTRDGQQPSRIDEAIEGIVTNSVVTDLNGNKKPELLIFVTGEGTGSYGKIYGYEFDSKYWGQLHMPALPQEQQQGYMGHDEYQVVDGRLARSFPVYLATDANCCPSGGTRTIFYTLNNALNFVVTKVQ
ncbi:hypothetical protein [Pontibacter chitinilyticus]|uniref:hypothetical protein n=1 Tax=Pontibacter chitinilyticus TaxID=2674989 RepID=UPI00321A93E3